MSIQSICGKSGNESIQDLSGSDTLVGLEGVRDSISAGTGWNMFQFLPADAGGKEVMPSFVSDKNQVFLAGHALSYFEAHHYFGSSGNNSYNIRDYEMTSVEFKGITYLSSSDVTTNSN